MKYHMRLFQQRGIWYVELRRNKKRSLRTRDEKEAQRRFKKIEREYLLGRVFKLDIGKRVTLKEFTEEYLTHRENMSPDTYAQDKLALRLLSDVVDSGTALRAITSKKIDDFKKVCLNRGVKPQSVNSYLRHIKCAFGVAEEWYDNYNRPKIKMCKTGKRLPRVIPKPDIDFVLRVAEESNCDLYKYIVFCLWTGCRRIEALRLRWQHVYIHAQKPYAKILGKGDKERIVPLLPHVVEMLERFRRDIGPVFLQVHPDTLSHWFHDLVVSCEIKARFHDLRHSAATYMLASGIPLEVVQKILGHAQISTTQIYAEVLEETLYKEMKKYTLE